MTAVINTMLAHLCSKADMSCGKVAAMSAFRAERASGFEADSQEVSAFTSCTAS
jgi:hypothetical protein